MAMNPKFFIWMAVVVLAAEFTLHKLGKGESLNDTLLACFYAAIGCGVAGVLIWIFYKIVWVGWLRDRFSQPLKDREIKEK
jgi:hypothetical protein